MNSFLVDENEEFDAFCDDFETEELDAIPALSQLPSSNASWLSDGSICTDNDEDFKIEDDFAELGEDFGKEFDEVEEMLATQGVLTRAPSQAHISTEPLFLPSPSPTQEANEVKSSLPTPALTPTSSMSSVLSEVEVSRVAGAAHPPHRSATLESQGPSSIYRKTGSRKTYLVSTTQLPMHEMDDLDSEPEDSDMPLKSSAVSICQSNAGSDSDSDIVIVAENLHDEIAPNLRDALGKGKKRKSPPFEDSRLPAKRQAMIATTSVVKAEPRPSATLRPIKREHRSLSTLRPFKQEPRFSGTLPVIKQEPVSALARHVKREHDDSFFYPSQVAQNTHNPLSQFFSSQKCGLQLSSSLSSCDSEELTVKDEELVSTHNPHMLDIRNLYSQFRAFAKGVDRATARRKFEALFRAAAETFDKAYGTDDEDIRSWRALCRDLAIEPIPSNLHDCREVVLTKHVNIWDLLEAHLNERLPPQIFDTLPELAAYSKGENLIFPLKMAVDGGVLKKLLRRIRSA